MPNMDMSGAPPRRRQQQPQQQQPPQPQYMPQYHPGMNPMYQNYTPYNAPPYYGVPPQYQNGGMPSPGYMQYQNYSRSPPAIPQYVPMTGVAVPPNYTHPSPHSPSLSTPYRPPPAPAPMTSHTPSSTQSSHVPPPPTPPTQQEEVHIAAAIPASEVAEPLLLVSRVAFRPPVCFTKLFHGVALTNRHSFLGILAPMSSFPPEPHDPNDEQDN